MLPTLGAPSKKSTPEQQMAMMRTYLNQLKDDTEGELYNIRWENLAKPLQDKLNGLDKDIVAQGEQFDYLNANMVSVGYLEANYLTASQIAANYIATNQLDAQLVNSYYLNSQYVYAGSIAAGQINSGTISAQYLDSSVITTNNMSAIRINANQINAGIISSARIDSSSISANVITSSISSSQTAYFGRINIDSGGMYIRTNNGMYKLSVRSVNSGGNTIYFLGTTTQPI